MNELASSALDHGGRGYPRPQLRRPVWWSLNGEWDFAIDAEGSWRLPREVRWEARIVVPLAPETPASGIDRRGFFRACWYRRRVELRRRHAAERWLLHFGAVDYAATVWIDGVAVATHIGGYTPFTCDITDLIGDRDAAEIVVRAEDDPQDLEKPRGKQDWQLEPHSIWYPRTTGIWQSVWLEQVAPTYIGRLSFTPHLAEWAIGVSAWLAGERRDDLRLSVRMSNRGATLVADSYLIVSGEVHRRIALSDPGVDDSRNELLWSPDAPNLIDVQMAVQTADGEIIDHIESYTALRSTAVQGDRFVLNNRPYVLRMVLDQGYWPESGMTAPDDAALRRDVLLAKRMGFNGVRKHQKIEDPRYLYWADRLGLAVWQEMPSAYRFTPTSVEHLSSEWLAAITRDCSHPCIVAWVPINESWGVPNLTDSVRERHYVEALYHLTHTVDPTRPVVGNDGWESLATDIIGIHDYDEDPGRIARRYHADDVLPRLFKRERPGGRLLVLEDRQHVDRPLMLTEFGGLALGSAGPGTWGYTKCATPEEFARRYRHLLTTVRNLGIISGFCYTQFADTYQEANGLLYADRTPKIPIDDIAEATAGRVIRSDALDQLDAYLKADPSAR
jgi:beta-galactosidase/beta-glucuronidase